MKTLRNQPYINQRVPKPRGAGAAASLFALFSQRQTLYTSHLGRHDTTVPTLEIAPGYTRVICIHETGRAETSFTPKRAPKCHRRGQWRSLAIPPALPSKRHCDPIGDPVTVAAARRAPAAEPQSLPNARPLRQPATRQQPDLWRHPRAAQAGARRLFDARL